jgi:hypothetical protein
MGLSLQSNKRNRVISNFVSIRKFWYSDENYQGVERLNSTDCSNRSRYKAPEILRNESYEKYVAMTKDEGNDVDGPISVIC